MGAPETMLQIAARISAEHGVTVAEIMGPSTKRRVSHVRHAIFAACRDTKRHSFEKIGRTFGRDVSSVQTGVKAHRRRNPEAGL